MKTTDNKNQSRARALLADIHGAPSTLIPRREPIVAWLDALLAGADRKGYVTAETETEDLAELDKFLREHDVPVAAEAA